jgi:hypothetical protein
MSCRPRVIANGVKQSHGIATSLSVLTMTTLSDRLLYKLHILAVLSTTTLS